MTCAKQRVECVIVTRDGKTFMGTNDCSVPQETCPRLPGEGYEKCRTICQQAGHAEAMAVLGAAIANVNLTDAHAIVFGHTRVCEDCKQILRDHGIEKVSIATPA